MPLPSGHILDLLCYIALGAFLATPMLLLNVRLAPLLGLIDWPKARGLAEDQIPIVGPSLVLLSVVTLAAVGQLFDIGTGLLPTAIVMAVMGHFDDRKPLSALDKILFQALCTAFVVFCDPLIRNAIGVPYGTWGYVLAFFLIIGLINAINFIDGIDGLAGMVLILGATGLLAFCHGSSDYYGISIYSAVLIGSLCPFFYLNVFKRKGFLGNVGSYFFSYVLAVLHLSVKMPSPHVFARLSLICLCFLVPLSDSIMVICSRLLSMRSPFQADKGHLHHRMVQTSIPLRYILVCFGAVELVGVLTAFLLNGATVLHGTSISIFLCGSYVLITTGLILFTEKASKKRVQNFLMRLDDNNPIFYFRYEVRHRDGSMPSATTLRRLEARISAEIRVTDVCFSSPPNRLFVCFATSSDPLRSISSRLDGVFVSEKIEALGTSEQGEIVRTVKSKKALPRPATARRKAS